MSDYTIQLRNLFETDRFGNQLFTREQVEGWFKDYELNDYLTTEQIQVIEQAGIWNKDKLAKRIVDHYYMREIGYETPAMFEHFAKVKMNEIMEYELPVIYSNSIVYDPMESVLFDITETREIAGTGSSNSESNSSGTGFSVNNDTPQTNINKTEILAGHYATNTNASETETGVTGSTSTTSNTTETWHHHEQGNKGVLDSYQKMIMQLRETFVAVDKRIIEQLDELFMGIY